MSTPESIQPIPDSGPVTITAKKQPHGEATFSVDDFPVEGAYLVLSADGACRPRSCFLSGH
ncbi:MAG: hypothetical protein UW70_C0021G0022 [Candidatus Peregrinibacteria bacterium GW2011_GWA2_44_7]|nr:MAG: hypothetical protein UW70_C0021G0022 [Candidatus Peregrinibacteria bacterium GW2011_GWA2_44_7]